MEMHCNCMGISIWTQYQRMIFFLKDCLIACVSHHNFLGPSHWPPPPNNRTVSSLNLDNCARIVLSIALGFRDCDGQMAEHNVSKVEKMRFFNFRCTMVQHSESQLSGRGKGQRNGPLFFNSIEICVEMFAKNTQLIWNQYRFCAWCKQIRCK